MSLMTLTGLSLRRGTRPVLSGIDLSVAPGEVVALVGPNGAGKTTLLRAALGLLPAEGFSSLATLPARERARRAAYLPQEREIAWPMPVADVVALGRAPHGGLSGPGDRAAVERAMERMGVARFRGRDATALSGGEQARVLMARALAQEAPLLLADEPTAGLDPAAQIAVMEVFSTLAAEGGAVIASLHDLGLALRHATRIVVLDGGRIAADGPARHVLTPEILARAFGITAWQAETPEGPVFQPLQRLS